MVYDPNGGVGGLTDAGIPMGSAYTVRSAADVNMYRPGYTFLDWNTSPDGAGIPYQPGEVTTIKQNLILYAQWEAVPQTAAVIYIANGGTGGLVDMVPVGNSYTIRSAMDVGVSWPGYVFIGWNTSPDGTGAFYQPGEVATIVQDLPLCAQWQRTALVDG